MNERIKELAKQCYETGPIGKDGWPEYSKFNEEKFAKLIVKECVTAFEAEVDTWKQMSPYQGSIKRQGTKAITQHFGVEE